MLLAEFDEEKFKRVSHRNGVREGREEKAVEDAIEFLKEGDSAEKISRCIGIPLDKVLELQKEITVHA